MPNITTQRGAISDGVEHEQKALLGGEMHVVVTN